MKRVIFDVFLFISVFVFTWWITLILSIIGLFIFESFYEFLMSSIIIYTLSSAGNYSIFSKSFLIYVLIILFYFLVQYLRRHIILYKNEIPYKT